MPPLAFFSRSRKTGNNEQKTRLNVNNHIYGGVGGYGGGGGVKGQGGSGGAGEGPTLNYYIDAEEGNINHIHRHGEQGLHILQRAAAGDSFHDSAERYPQPRCHPETRTEMLEDLTEWASSAEPDHSLLWLHGPAGAGKSAIAQSLCQQLEAEGRLGASFFFKRKDSSRGNAKRLFPTLAYQLALVSTRLNHAISQKVEKNPSILDRSFSTQLRKLILEPCRQSSYRRTLVIVVDGLDECEGHNIQQEILRSIGNVLDEGPLPLRFFVASRPEPHICEMFTGVLKGIHRPLNIEQSFEDVRKYLLDEFGRIHGEHHETMTMIPKPWPSPKIISNLVKKSSGYFIYASTVIKFIDDKNFRPTERLKVILGAKERGSGSPFAALDELYIQILSAIPDRPRLLKILTVIAAKLDLPFGYTDKLLDLEPGDVQLALRGLQSVIHVEKKNLRDQAWEPQIMVYHASFYDFLHDRTRAGIFYVGDGPHLTDVCCHILRALSYTYEDPNWNTERRSHVSWYLSRYREVLECITASEPSPGLLSLFRSFNPDLLFGQENPENANVIVNIVLDWLKRSRPLPKDLIHLWEDYRFMIHCQSIWSNLNNEEIRVHRRDQDQDHSATYQILSQASPSLIRILQAMLFIKFHRSKMYFTLLATHLLLYMSWDELRTAISSLRPLIPSDSKSIARTRDVFIVALDSAFFPMPFDSIMWSLTCGALRLTKKALEDELDEWMLYRLAAGWGLYLRSCPPSSELLQHLRDLEPLLELPACVQCLGHECHNIAQWLKKFPRRPLELISSFERYTWYNKYSPRQREEYKRIAEHEWKEWNKWYRYSRLDTSIY